MRGSERRIAGKYQNETPGVLNMVTDKLTSRRAEVASDETRDPRNGIVGEYRNETTVPRLNNLRDAAIGIDVDAIKAGTRRHCSVRWRQGLDGDGRSPPLLW